MGWAVGYSDKWQRDIGYGVPAKCDHPDCDEEIDRGLAHLCGDIHEPDTGCGLHFCSDHLGYRKPRHHDRHVQNCPRCRSYKAPYKPKPDTAEWADWKMRHPSWAAWRAENGHPEPANPIVEAAE